MEPEISGIGDWRKRQERHENGEAQKTLQETNKEETIGQETDRTTESKR